MGYKFEKLEGDPYLLKEIKNVKDFQKLSN